MALILVDAVRIDRGILEPSLESIDVNESNDKYGVRTVHKSADSYVE